MDRRQELMQSSLDGELSPEEERELSELLNSSAEALSELDRQQAVHRMLNRPPHARAPERLAPVIMARIAQMMREQRTQVAGQTDLDELAEAILDVALATVTVATLPLLVGAGWLALNSKSSPEVIEAVLAQVALLVMLVMDVIQVMLEEAQAAFEDDPEAALAILTMIPMTLLLLVRQVLGIDEDEDEREE